MLRQSYSPVDDNIRYRLKKAIIYSSIRSALGAFRELIEKKEKIDQDLANRAFSLGVEKLHEEVVKHALKLGANIETPVKDKPPLFYLCGVDPSKIPAAIIVAETLLNSGASLSKSYIIKTEQGEQVMNALECASLSPSDKEGLMSDCLKRHQQAHPELQVVEEARQHEGAAASLEPFHAPGGPLIEEDFQKLAGEEYAQGPCQD